MLILNRKSHEAILIGTKEDFEKGTEIKVIMLGQDSKRPNSFAIGIQAGSEITILREELGPEISKMREK